MDIDMLQAQIDALTERVKELEAKLLKIHPPLPWDEAPEWARWAAMDEDGDWWWYSEEPTIRSISYSPDNIRDACLQFNHAMHTNWRKSKQARPLAQP